MVCKWCLWAFRSCLLLSKTFLVSKKIAGVWSLQQPTCLLFLGRHKNSIPCFYCTRTNFKKQNVLTKNKKKKTKKHDYIVICWIFSQTCKEKIELLWMYLTSTGKKMMSSIYIRLTYLLFHLCVMFHCRNLQEQGKCRHINPSFC